MAMGNQIQVQGLTSLQVRQNAIFIVETLVDYSVFTCRIYPGSIGNKSKLQISIISL